MKHLYSIILITIIAFSSMLYAEDSAIPMPNESVALGAIVGDDSGAFLNYAMTRDFHLGAQVGMFYNTVGDGGADWLIAVYARAFLLRIQNMNVFASGKFSVRGFAGSDDSPTDLRANVGGMWYPFENLGVFAGVNVLYFDINESDFGIGIGAPFIGIEYYLN